MENKTWLLFLLLLIVIVGGAVIATPHIIKWQWEMRGISEEGRRDTFEETKSYNESKEQDLLRYRLEYLKTEDETEKKAIASTIRLMFADYDEDLLSPELRDFLLEIKYGEY